MRPGFPLFWQPRSVASSLASLPLAGSVRAKHDVTRAVTGQDFASHPLIVAELAGGKIIGDLRLAATAEDQVIGGMQSIFGCDRPESHYLIRRRRLRFPVRRPGTGWLLGMPNGDNYYHWLLDSLPRWQLLQAAGWRDYDWVLLPAGRTRFQDELLDRLQVPAEKRLRCNKHFIHQFDRLVVPAMPFPLEEVSRWACDWVRSLFPTTGSGPEKIYLSRRGGRGRQIVNEAELQSALEARGFVVLQMEQFSVTEQAAQLSGARCVVAAHGAALSNLVFAPPGALLLELFHPQHKNRCYVNLAAACGHRYASLDGQPVQVPARDVLACTIDVAAVVRTIATNS